MASASASAAFEKMSKTLGNVEKSSQFESADRLIDHFISWRSGQEEFAAAAAESIAAKTNEQKASSLERLKSAKAVVVYTTKNLMKDIDEYIQPKYPLGTRLAQKESGEVKPHFYVDSPAEIIRLEQFKNHLKLYLRFVEKFTIPEKVSLIRPNSFTWTKRVANVSGKTIARLEGNYRQNLSVRKIRPNGTHKLNSEGKYIFKTNGTPELLPVDYISIADLKRLLLNVIPDRVKNKYRRQLGLEGANNNAMANAAALVANSGNGNVEGGKRKTRRRRHSRRRHTRRN